MNDLEEKKKRVAEAMEDLAGTIRLPHAKLASGILQLSEALAERLARLSEGPPDEPLLRLSDLDGRDELSIRFWWGAGIDGICYGVSAWAGTTGEPSAKDLPVFSEDIDLEDHLEGFELYVGNPVAASDPAEAYFLRSEVFSMFDEELKKAIGEGNVVVRLPGFVPSADGRGAWQYDGDRG